MSKSFNGIFDWNRKLVKQKGVNQVNVCDLNGSSNFWKDIGNVLFKCILLKQLFFIWNTTKISALFEIFLTKRITEGMTSCITAKTVGSIN